MITKPSCGTLLDVVRTLIHEVIAETNADAGALGRVAMIDEILRCLSIRSENEMAWMIEETVAIKELATILAEDGFEPDARIAAMLMTLDGNDQLRSLEALAGAYSDATEVLSWCIEVALPAGGRAWQLTQRVIEMRLEHEAVIRGANFAVVARG